MKIRKDFNIKVNMSKISEFIGCNSKGVYYIENNIQNTKSIRYLMYMRKKGLNVNKLIDRLNENENVNENIVDN